jgi:hypothetical protein
MSAKKTKKHAANGAVGRRKSKEPPVLVLGKQGRLKIADIRKAVLAVREQRLRAAN